jgi:hypothetical protein
MAKPEAHGMISEETIAICREIGDRAKAPDVWLRLGIACGSVNTALEGEQPPRDLLERMAELNTVKLAEERIGEWIRLRKKAVTAREAK